MTTPDDNINIAPVTPNSQGSPEPEREEKKRNNRAPVKPMLLLGEILLTGTAGWKQLRRARLTPEKAAAGCFYPLLAIGAVAQFADCIYMPEFNIASTLVEAATFFASFFFSYFAVQVVCRWLYPSEAKSKTETNFFKLIVQYALASLALFCIPTQILPILTPIAVFLPIWTIFIITKAVRFLRFPSSCQTRCMVTLVLATIIMPYLFMWIGSLLANNQ